MKRCNQKQPLTTTLLKLSKDEICYITRFLDHESLLTFTLTCIRLFKCISEMIYSGKWFNLPSTFEKLFVTVTLIRKVRWIHDTLPKAFPPNITHITFSQRFQQPVDNLPDSVTHLTFGREFNQPIDNLPPSVTHLTFGTWFNQPVEQLPPNVTHLTFGYWFNQPVDNLPSSITHITFGYRFNQPVHNLPPSLKRLEISKRYPHEVHVPEGCKIIKK